MAGSLARQGRGVIGQGWQGHMAHISPGYTLTLANRKRPR